MRGRYTRNLLPYFEGLGAEKKGHKTAGKRQDGTGVGPTAFGRGETVGGVESLGGGVHHNLRTVKA